MEIAGGFARGTALEVPRGLEVRPTSIRARRALFDSLGDLSGKRVCDLFAGSGAMGLEAVSRGAESLLAVECAPASVAAIRKNMKSVAARMGWKDEKEFSSKMRLVQGTLPACIKTVTASPPADIIFADPPYADSTDAAARLLADGDFLEWSEKSLLIWELPESRAVISSLPETRRVADVRKYGAIRFMFICGK